ncbi:MAG: phosphotransferase, partial [Patescibacteria group bacterium]
MQIQERLENLKNVETIKTLLKNHFPASQNINIEIKKEYMDERSYSLVAIYAIDGTKVVGVANSDGRKKTDYEASNLIYKHIKSQPQFHIPQPIHYDDENKIYFREYIPGNSLHNLIKAADTKVTEILDCVQNFLLWEQKLSYIPNTLTKGILTSNFKTNMQLINNPEFREMCGIILKALDRAYATTTEYVFVHGDVNPNNIFTNSSCDITLIDLELAHWGCKEEDFANLNAHLTYSIENYENHAIEIPKGFD